jgi:hypothetical protein
VALYTDLVFEADQWQENRISCSFLDVLGVILPLETKGDGRVHSSNDESHLSLLFAQVTLSLSQLLS